MQLQRLTGLERQKILDELAELMKLIERLRAILANQQLLLKIIVDELKAVQEKFADPRRTMHHRGRERVQHRGPDRRRGRRDHGHRHRLHQAHADHRPTATQRRGGKGRIGMRTREEDMVNHLFVASTHSFLMIFSDRGRAYWLKVHEIPDVGADGRGKSIANLVQMEAGEKIAAMLARARVRRHALHRDGHPQGHGQEDRALGVQQPARRRHHRDGHRGRRRGHARAALRRPERGVHRHARRHGDPLPRRRRPRRWAARPTASAASSCARATKSWRWRWSSRAARCSPSPSRATASRPTLDEYRVTGPRRPRAQEHRDHRQERPGGRHRAGARRRGAAGHHRAGQDPAHAGQRDPHHRPRHAGRAPDGPRGAGQGGVGRARGEDRGRSDRRRTGRPEPEEPSGESGPAEPV